MLSKITGNLKDATCPSASVRKKLTSPNEENSDAMPHRLLHTVWDKIGLSIGIPSSIGVWIAQSQMTGLQAWVQIGGIAVSFMTVLLIAVKIYWLIRNKGR